MRAAEIAVVGMVGDENQAVDMIMFKQPEIGDLTAGPVESRIERNGQPPIVCLLF